jgi:hypothetical protein
MRLQSTQQLFVRSIYQFAMLLALAFMTTFSDASESRTELKAHKIPYMWANALRTALEEFAKIDVADRSCYTVGIAAVGEGVEVVMIPSRAADEASVRGGRTRCGPEVTYKVSNAGKLIDTTFSR